ncbi:MAG: hypothetical protein WBV82_26255 [Myxococcaceae bacterium]
MNLRNSQLSVFAAVATFACSFAAHAEGDFMKVVNDTNAHVQLYGTDVTGLNLALKMGSPTVYGMATVGMQPTFLLAQDARADGHLYSLGLGVGAHFKLAPRFSLDADLSGSFLNAGGFIGNAQSVLGTLRVMANYEITDRFSVFAGPTLQSSFDFGGNAPRDLGLGFAPKMTVAEGDLDVRAWPGFVIGVQL